MGLKEFENREGAVPRPELENLAKCLLVPRRPIRFKEVGEVDAWVEPVNSDSTSLIKPVVITSRGSHDFVGFQSGRRSGLISIDGVVYKIKGCRVESALETEGLYRVNHGTFDPHGGQLLQGVDDEIYSTNEINTILTKEGFPVVQEPKAVIHYGKLFKSRSDFSEKLARKSFLAIRHRDPNILFQDHLDEGELAAFVMQVKGDTRLHELYRQEVKDVEAASTLAHRFGLMAGAQKRVTEAKFLWRDDAHTGNYVIFVENGQVHLAMVDFGDALPYQDAMFRSLDSMRRNLEIQHIFSSMNRSRLRYSIAYSAGGLGGLRGFMQGQRLNAPEYFRGQFRRGFMDGYRNPDRREPIPRADLSAAYGLKA